jgi:Tol biopolymer transport system component
MQSPSFVSHRLAFPVSILIASFSLLIGARGEVFFLIDGKLTAFDRKQKVNVERSWLPANTRLLHLMDSKAAPGASRLLLAKQVDDRFVPNSDAATGVDLWLRDESGAERLIHPSVYRARFSPDGRRIAYTTSDSVLRIEDLSGRKHLEIDRAYNPRWRSDGREILFEKVPEGRPTHIPETLHIARLNVESGKVDLLTDGTFDDVRPEYHPLGKWILFVNGGRTGFASFWRINAAGGKPEQITNIGIERIDASFVPTPYRQTIWSADGRWFLYDFKSGDVRQVWGLEFNPAGQLLRAIALAEGLYPQWLEEGKTFAYVKYDGKDEEPAIGSLP